MCTHFHESHLEGYIQCFFQPTEKQIPNENDILYDFETYHNGNHGANFVCIMDMNGNKFWFNTLKCAETFVRHLRCPKYANYTFLAHNASRFDMYLVLEYFVKQGMSSRVTMTRSRVILIFDNKEKQRWIDFFSFLLMLLSQTPAAMEFEDLKKGYFPHKLTRTKTM